MHNMAVANIEQIGGKSDHASSFYVALSIFVLLLAIYSLTYSGTFVTDDEHILASRTLSLAFDERINDSRVYGNGRVFALANLPPEQAAQAVNIEPGQALFGALLARLAVLLGVGRIQTIFLLNIWVTALTTLVTFGTVVVRGHSTLTATVTALLFSLGTLAWPYTRTYFRDPLAMLFLAVAWGCAQIIAFPNGKLFESKRFYWLLKN